MNDRTAEHGARNQRTISWIRRTPSERSCTSERMGGCPLASNLELSLEIGNKDVSWRCATRAIGRTICRMSSLESSPWRGIVFLDSEISVAARRVSRLRDKESELGAIGCWSQRTMHGRISDVLIMYTCNDTSTRAT